jgi:rhamnulose-1-phosphate aldolase/alcohol dehydrogenase
MLNRWSDQAAEKLEGLDLLVHTTRLIGAETKLVVWGGGNSSVKTVMADHRGRETRVLWVKGSGSDMRTITAQHFTPLRLDDLLLLWDRTAMADEEMVDYQSRCLLAPQAPKPSIETLLHAFLPAPHIYHTHPDMVCALTDVSDSSTVIKRVFGENVALIPYRRPGYALAKLVGEALRQSPNLRAIVLDKHGLITWGATAKEAYLKTIEMVSEAESCIHRALSARPWPRSEPRPRLSHDERRERAAAVALALRGAISRQTRMLVTFDDHPEILHFLEGDLARESSQAGPLTPDHILHTKPKPLFFDVSPSDSSGAIKEAVEQGVEAYRCGYRQYFERHKTPEAVMQDPNPRVILVPGLGLFTTGKDRRACRIAHDLYLHTMKTIVASSAIDTYTTLSLKEYFEFEYWPLETYKLTLLPQEKELSRRIVLITGAAGAIGKAIATRFAATGASVILTDIDQAKLEALSAELNRQFGEEVTTPIAMDVRDETSVAQTFHQTVRAYGGLDICVSNAGIARSGPVESLSLADWEDSLAVNATGHFLVCREAMRVFRRQGLGGNIVVVATKNVLAPGKEFGAYSASKAAQVQLARVLALEGGEWGIRVNMVNPDAVLDDSGLWSPAMRQARAQAYGIQPDELERYCIARNLLKVKITAQDVAEAVLYLASDRSAKTTGAMIPVDGGVKEAFPR